MKQLTPEQEQLLSTFTDPDVAAGQYKWDEEFQRHILSMLLTDRQFLVHGVALVKPNYFTNEAHQTMCRVLFEYFNKYKQMPQKQFVIQEVKDISANRPEKTRWHFLQELGCVYDFYKPGTEHRDYLTDKIANFAKIQETWIAFHKCVTEIKKAPEDEDTWQKVHGILREAMLIERDFDPGLFYFESVDERYERMQEKIETGEVFTSGLKRIDEALNGGLGRGELASIIGLPGSGKSLFMVMVAVKNLALGKKVLYVSLEMDQDKIAQRFDAQLANADIRKLVANQEVVKQALAETAAEYEDGRRLVIKKFRPGEMDVNKLRAYHQQMVLRGFVPDVIVVDYVGEMKDFPDIPTHESRYRIVRDMRAFAEEVNVFIMTGMQPNKSARDAQDPEKFGGSGVIDDTNIGDSFAQTKPLDAFWSLNQTNAEKEAKVGRFFVIKHRDGESRFMCYLQYDEETLEMRQISKETYNQIYRRHINEKEVYSSSDVEEHKIEKFPGDKDADETE